MRYPIGIQRLGNIRKVGTVWWLMRQGLLLAAVMLTAGCGSGSGEEPKSPEPGHVTPGSGSGSETPPGGTDSDMPILFSAKEHQATDVTRAVGLEDLKIFEFTVFGYKNKPNVNPQLVFPAYIVRWIYNSHSTTTTNTNDWEYVDQQAIGAAEQTIKYWDFGAEAYRFFGHTGDVTVASGASDAANLEAGAVVVGGNANVSSGAYRTLSFVADADHYEAAPYFSKLWYSDNVNDFGRPVQLEFMRPFVQVRMIITLAYPDATLLMEDLNFKPSTPGEKIKTAGTFVVRYPLTGDGENERHESFDIEFLPGKSAHTGLPSFTDPYTDDNPRWYTVLPGDQGEYTFSVTINKEPKTVVVPAEYMAWKPGYEYTYSFKISEQGGVEIGGVQSAYIDWEKVDATHYVYNW